MDEAARLEADGLVVLRRGVEVLKGASLCLQPGESVELAGPSGAGKSTLLLALARLLPRERGLLSCGGTPAAEVAPELWRSRVTYVPQSPAALPGSIRENLAAAFGLRVRRGAEVPGTAAMAAVLRRLLPELALDAPAAAVSGGQLSRLALTRAVLTRPAVLLLDEPVAMLDEESAQRVDEEVTRHCGAGGIVLRASHVRSAAGTRRLRLHQGRLEEAE